VYSREKFTDSGGTYENKAYQEAKEKQYLFHRSRRLCGNLHLQHWLQKRLTEFAVKYPAECRQLDDDGNGCKAFAIKKGRFGIRLAAPYSEKRRQAASKLAKKNTQNLRENDKIKFVKFSH
jgi:hypothetical protein